MADEPASISILANHVAKKHRLPLYGSQIAEVSAIALDLSAMMSQVVPALELIAEIPEVARSANGVALRSHLSRLKARFEAHAKAMAELNRAG
jgi:hypothetical protein